MKTTTVLLTLAIGLTLASHAHAQDPEGQVPLRRDAFEPGSRIELYKDPLVAAYLSATLPGLGHLYVGKKAHGTLFLATIVGAFGSAYAFYKPSELEITDYDRTVYGGNGDGMLSVAEAQNWEDG
ncbi:MAG: hypothetical protein QGI83_12920, partial [Candidatus Latescibacteria bacterium]|nr:hypothetical protein [Candidatus Latescibacterota bacterium]